MIQLSRAAWELLACFNGASPDWIIVVVVVLCTVVQGFDTGNGS